MISPSPRGGEVAAGRRGHSVQAYSVAHAPSAPFNFAQGRRSRGHLPAQARRCKESPWRLETREQLGGRRARVASGPLPEDENAGDNEEGKKRRDREATDGETAVGNRLVEKVADGRAQGTREDEGTPEQQRARDVGKEVRRRDDSQPGTENQGAALVAQSCVGHPVAERRSQGLRKQDGDPVEHLDLRRID